MPSFSTSGRKPVVAVTACRTHIDGVPHESVRTKYVEAVRVYADVNPVVLPTCGTCFLEGELLDSIDGLVLTGSSSNVNPETYGATGQASPADAARDETTLNLIKPAIEVGVPLLGICRGLQEMNVACGGDLHQNLADEPDMLRHQEDLRLPRDKQYLPVHPVDLTADGALRNWLGADRVIVNSLHRQGIRNLGAGLRVEAVASDGLVEALSVVSATTFAFAVQWHPEWHVVSDRVSQEIFRRFGDACRCRLTTRLEQVKC